MNKLLKVPSGLRVFRNEPGARADESFCPLALGIQALAFSFPTLRTLPGIDPWDVEMLATRHIATCSSGTRQALLFVLSTWNPEAPEFYELEPFDLHYALKIWDTEHRSAFVAWAQNPWWP